MTKIRSTRNEIDEPRNELTQITGRQRVRVGSGSGLAVSADLLDDEFFYYWGINEPGKIEELLNAGFEFVLKDGEQFSVSGGVGSPFKHILMRTPKEFHEADMAAMLESLQEQTQKQIELASDEYSPSHKGQAISRDLI